MAIDEAKALRAGREHTSCLPHAPQSARALALGDRDKGEYLGQAFTGRVIGLSGPVGHRRIEIRLNQPVDAVRFASFSNLCRQLVATIDEDRRSLWQTSDGKPQLLVVRGG